jgi:hypothetical protein
MALYNAFPAFGPLVNVPWMMMAWPFTVTIAGDARRREETAGVIGGIVLIAEQIAAEIACAVAPTAALK